MTYKLGSLFDGSGGFPLAGSLCYIEPVWAAEVEPYPIAVTRSRFPNMKHLGDISKVNGAEIEPVDIITFGSPCQDLSVAGKRAGLKHEDNGDEETTRSGLFMEAVRIIKEMRGATNGRYPTFALWENVPGAFSSNKGEDFRVVLEELIKIVEPTAKMPPCDKNGWPYADCYMGTGWSCAYRVFDAQYWGVPQRRRRIHLVLDLRGERAHKVLFEREGLRGYFAQGRTPWQGSAGDAEDRAGTADQAGVGLDIYNLAVTGDTAMNITSGAADPHHIPSVMEVVAYNGENITSPLNKTDPQPGDPHHTLGTDSRNYAVITAGFKAGNSARANGIGYEEEEVSPTLSAAPSGTNQAPSVVIELRERERESSDDLGCERQRGWSCLQHPDGRPREQDHGLHERGGGEEVICLDRAYFNQGENAKYDPQLYVDDTCPTLVAREPATVCVKKG